MRGIGSARRGRSTRRPTRRGEPRPGFTAMELLIVMVIVAILASVAFPAASRGMQARQANNARDALVWLGARSMAVAHERGRPAFLELDPASNRAWIRVGADTVEVLDVHQHYGANLGTASGEKLTVCYSPRGFAMAGCSSELPASIFLARGVRQAAAVVQPLGSVEPAS